MSNYNCPVQSSRTDSVLVFPKTCSSSWSAMLIVWKQLKKNQRQAPLKDQECNHKSFYYGKRSQILLLTVKTGWFGITLFKSVISDRCINKLTVKSNKPSLWSSSFLFPFCRLKEKWFHDYKSIRRVVAVAVTVVFFNYTLLYGLITQTHNDIIDFVHSLNILLLFWRIFNRSQGWVINSWSIEERLILSTWIKFINRNSFLIKALKKIIIVENILELGYSNNRLDRLKLRIEECFSYTKYRRFDFQEFW